MAAYLDVEGDPDDDLFDICSRFMRRTKLRNSNERLMVYGLFKQATEGDVTASRPGLLDMVGRAKWDAWKQLEGQTKLQARTGYIKYVMEHHGPAFQDFMVMADGDGLAEEEDLEGDEEGGGGGGDDDVSMAQFVSTLGGTGAHTTTEDANAEAAGEIMTKEQFAGLAGCAAKGDVGEVRRLLAAGAPVDGRDDLGRTALHWAAEGGYGDIVEALVEAGGGLDVADGDAETPLIIACVCEHAAIARRLVEAGASVDLGDEDGNTPASLARESGNAELMGAVGVVDE